MKKTKLKRVIKCFSVDFNPIDTNNILNTINIWLKEQDIK